MSESVMTRRVLPWLLTALLLAAAWGVVKITLPPESAQAPFVTVATTGELAAARNLAVTITDVHAARAVVDSAGWSATGTWVTIDLEAAARVSQEGASLRVATLTIGDRVFSATERGSTLYQQGLVPGIPRSGSLAFELPDDALGESAILRLAAAPNPVLDGVVEMTIDLADLPVESEATLRKSGWAR